jgi:hypothetical protein
VRRQPPEWYAIAGAELVRDLARRRDRLPQAAEAFYEQLSRYVDVQGTDLGDEARLTREADGSATLELSAAGGAGAPGSPYFKRRFLPGETKEVRVYLYGGDDRFSAVGPRGGIPVRLSGGAGADLLDDSQSGGNRFYDVDGPTEVVKGPETGVSDRKWTRIPRKAETPWMEKQDFGSLTPFTPLLWWEPDPGVVVSVGAAHYRYGFRKQPYASMQRFSVEWKTKRSAFAANYAADFRWARPGFGTFVEASADGADNYNFYGFGNETQGEQDEFTEADQQVVEAFPSLVAYENARRTYWVALGPDVKFSRSRAADDTLIGMSQPYGFGDFGQAGARLRFELDTRSRSLVGMGAAGFAPGSSRSDTGLKLQLDGRIYPKGWDVEEAFGSAEAALTGYWQASSRLTLAGRLGGQKLWGRYPWHEAAFIGGSDTVRGYGRNRYAGDSSVYANAQVMVGLFDMNLILPMRVGVLGLADVGRVWLEGESSDEWHPAYGGGLFLRVLTTPAVFHGLVAQGDDGAHFYVNVGFGL